MNYRPDFVNLDESIGNTDFRVMTCKNCGHVSKPYAKGPSSLINRQTVKE